jgi:Uma2 family endonuclease
MSTIAATRPKIVGRTEVSPEELLAMPEGKHYELVDGLPVEQTMSLLAGLVEARLTQILAAYCEGTRVGWVLSSACGYRCFSWKPRQVRRPDVSFIARERLPSESQWSEGYVTIPPDLAVEVTSPSDEVYDLEEKVEEYLRAGVQLIWVIHPEIRVIQVIRGDRSGSRLQVGDELSGEDVVPGFRCPVASVFPAGASHQAGAGGASVEATVP